MLDTGLPCFRPQTIENLIRRLAPEKTEKEAALHMTQQCYKALSTLATSATYLYDLFQLKTQGIDYWCYNSNTTHDQSTTRVEILCSNYIRNMINCNLNV